MITAPYIAGPSAYSTKWYAYRIYDPIRVDRPVVIGGSQAAACLGVDKYKSPLQLFLELRGEAPPIQSNKAMERGKKWERFILEEYEEEEHAELAYDQPMYFSRAFPFMGVTPDALRVDIPKGVDAKASRFSMRDKTGLDESKFGEPGTDQVPINYLCQAQQYCAVLGLDAVDFPVLFGGDQLCTYTVGREDSLVEDLQKAEREMAERVINNDPPEPTWEMPGTNKLLQHLYGFRPEEKAELTDQAAELWRQVARWQDEAKRLDEQITTNKNKILAEMGGAEFGVFPNGKQGVKRVKVRDSFWTHTDIATAEKNLGTLKRAGHERLQLCRV